MSKRTYQQYMLSRLKLTADQASAELAAMLGEVRPPLVISCGLGVDSVAVLVGLWRRGVRPDLVKFANVGRRDFSMGEKRATIAYLAILNAWCRRVGFPEVTVVHKESALDESLYDECWRKSMLPSIAYGGHSCSSKWKQGALEKFSNNWRPAQLAWACGLKMVRVIGYDAGPRDCARQRKAVTYVERKGDHKHEYWYPLQEWGWDRDECVRQIVAAGLPVPPKSSCTFCAAMKVEEVREIWLTEPDTFAANLSLEARAIGGGRLDRNKKGELKIKGLGRRVSWAELAEKFRAEGRAARAGLVQLTYQREVREAA